MNELRTSDSQLCPHGFDKRSVHCCRCADPAFDSARGWEMEKAAMNTIRVTIGGPMTMTNKADPVPSNPSNTPGWPIQSKEDALRAIAALPVHDCDDARNEACLRVAKRLASEALVDRLPDETFVQPPPVTLSTTDVAIAQTAATARAEIRGDALKAFVHLCAPHGHDWLTCPECAKAAEIGNQR